MQNQEHYKQLVSQVATYINLANRRGAFELDESADVRNLLLMLQNWQTECEDCEGKKEKAKAKPEKQLKDTHDQME